MTVDSWKRISDKFIMSISERAAFGGSFFYLKNSYSRYCFLPSVNWGQATSRAQGMGSITHASRLLADFSSNPGNNPSL